MDNLLEGIKVLELGQFIPAPYASLTLADLGADVIKIEPPQGDPMRLIGSVKSEGVTAAYESLNGNKKIVFLNLKTSEGQVSAQALATKADVLIESYRPRVLQRLGLGRDVLEQLNPLLVHCAISGFGQNGPLASKAGHDLSYIAASGALSISGTKERPVMDRIPISDYAAGLQAATAILAALMRRQRKGAGCYIDIAMADTMLAWQAHILSDALSEPTTIHRGWDADTGGFAYYNIYKTSCGSFVSITAEDPRHWQRFCDLVGRPELGGRQFEVALQDELIEIVQQIFSTKDAVAWGALLDGADCCFQRLLSPAQAVSSPQFLARGMINRRGTLVDPLRPYWIDSLPPSPRERFRQLTPAEATMHWSV